MLRSTWKLTPASSRIRSGRGSSVPLSERAAGSGPDRRQQHRNPRQLPKARHEQEVIHRCVSACHEVGADRSGRDEFSARLLRQNRDSNQGVFGFIEMNFHDVTGASGLPRFDRVDQRGMRLDDSSELTRVVRISSPARIEGSIIPDAFR